MNAKLDREPASVSRDAKRTANLRTAAILGSIALVFFGGIVASQLTGAASVGIGVLGFAIIGFLAIAILRNVLR